MTTTHSDNMALKLNVENEAYKFALVPLYIAVHFYMLNINNATSQSVSLQLTGGV
jgi:hypothetical protein